MKTYRRLAVLMVVLGVLGLVLESVLTAAPRGGGRAGGGRPRVGAPRGVALRRAGRRVARRLKPGVLVGGMVHHEIDDHQDAAFFSLMHELDEISAGAVARIDPVKIGNVVPVIAVGRWVKRGEPDGADSERL